jgi:hypothetical protein
MSKEYAKVELLHAGFSVLRSCDEGFEVIELTKDQEYAGEVAARFPDREVRKVFFFGDPVDITQEEAATHTTLPVQGLGEL